MFAKLGKLGTGGTHFRGGTLSQKRNTLFKTQTPPTPAARGRDGERECIFLRDFFRLKENHFFFFFVSSPSFFQNASIFLSSLGLRKIFTNLRLSPFFFNFFFLILSLFFFNSLSPSAVTRYTPWRHFTSLSLRPRRALDRDMHHRLDFLPLWLFCLSFLLFFPCYFALYSKSFIHSLEEEKKTKTIKIIKSNKGMAQISHGKNAIRYFQN